MPAHSGKPIALVGLMGAGKTAVAHALGERLAVSVADLDAMIEAEQGCSIAELFAREGEPAFRRREGEVLRSALASGARVIACGGGIVLDPAHRASLAQSCRVVWLRVTPAEAARRVLADARNRRPLLEGEPAEERLVELLRSRAPLYEDVASAVVDTTGRTPEQAAAAVLEALHLKA
jgi:shikimate kinase